MLDNVVKMWFYVVLLFIDSKAATKVFQTCYKCLSTTTYQEMSLSIAATKKQLCIGVDIYFLHLSASTATNKRK